MTPDPFAPDPFARVRVWPGNRFSHAAAKAVAENPGKVYNPLHLYGPRGRWSSATLFEALRETLIRKWDRVLVLRGRDLAARIEREDMEALADFDALCVDDMDRLRDQPVLQAKLGGVVRVYQKFGGQVVLRSVAGLPAFPVLKPRFKSMEWGLTTEVRDPFLWRVLAMGRIQLPGRAPEPSA